MLADFLTYIFTMYRILSRRKILMKNSRDLPLIESSNRPNLISLIGCYSKFGNAHLEMRKEIGIRTKKCNIISLGMDSG